MATPSRTAASPNVLELKGVSKSFVNPDGKLFQAIKDVNLTIKDEPDVGEFRVFLGPSGCGKSTILNIVAGLFTPTEGEALVRGTPVTGPGPDRGMVFQSYSSYPWLTVLDNVAFGLMLRGCPGDREGGRRTWIKKGPRGAEKKYPRQPRAMRQRRPSRALAARPQIILMDEPSAPSTCRPASACRTSSTSCGRRSRARSCS
jgi:ABC-type taurine transport system ATPase subunit